MFSLPEDIIPVIAAFTPLFSVRVWASTGAASWRDLDPRQGPSQRGVAHNGFVPRPPLHQLSSGVESGGMEPVAGQSGSVGTDLEAVVCGCACGHRRR